MQEGAEALQGAERPIGGVFGREKPKRGIPVFGVRQGLALISIVYLDSGNSRDLTLAEHQKLGCPSTKRVRARREPSKRAPRASMRLWNCRRGGRGGHLPTSLATKKFLFFASNEANSIGDGAREQSEASKTSFETVKWLGNFSHTSHAVSMKRGIEGETLKNRAAHPQKYL